MYSKNSEQIHIHTFTYFTLTQKNGLHMSSMKAFTLELRNLIPPRKATYGERHHLQPRSYLLRLHFTHSGVMTAGLWRLIIGVFFA